VNERKLDACCDTRALRFVTGVTNLPGVGFLCPVCCLREIETAFSMADRHIATVRSEAFTRASVATTW